MNQGEECHFSWKKVVVFIVVTVVLVEIHIVAKLEDKQRQAPYKSSDWDEEARVLHINITPIRNRPSYADEVTTPDGNLREKSTPISAATPDSTDTILTTSAPADIESKLNIELQRKLKEASDKKIILIWSLAFGNKDPHGIDSSKCGNCDVTYDRSLITDERTKAVVFHFDSIRSNDVPSPRNPNHLHIFWDMESSATLKVARGLSLNFEDSHKFNATMTHRLDSTFLSSYQSASLGDEMMGKDESIFEDIMKQKSKLAIVMISNCGYTPGARIRIRKIRELKSLGIALDGFGGCFGNKISWNDVPNKIKQYKFYFSYENSYHCKDYITEKFFNNALKNHAVPVVWGATKQDYEAIAPSGSFIFADDFATSQKLIEHLNYLDQNKEEYLKYFRWLTMKPQALPQYKRARGFCAICREVHGINVDERFSPKYDAANPFIPMFSNGIFPRTVPSLIQWFYGQDNPECFNK